MKRLARSQPLVLVFHTASRIYWSDIVQGVSAFARQAGWNLQVVENELDSQVMFRDLIRFWNPDGCIFEDSISRCAKADIHGVGDIPTVFVNCEMAKRLKALNTITVNSQEIGALAAREFLAVGLQNFAYYGFSEFQWSDERLEGFAAALRLNGRKCSAFKRSFKNADRTYRKKLVDWVESLPQQCGIFAANDLLATELINACSLVGRKIPDDVCIIGVDNDVESCESMRPTLTSINPDFVKEGFWAAGALAKIMQGKKLTDEERTFGVPVVVRRQSTRRLKVRTADMTAALEFIRLNACRGISSKDVFALFSCTRRRVEQRFRAELGHSVLEEINAVRLAKAEELLRRPNVAIESIAGSCGFQSTAHLRVLFRRVTGLSLRAWREMRKCAHA